MVFGRIYTSKAVKGLKRICELSGADLDLRRWWCTKRISCEAFLEWYVV